MGQQGRKMKSKWAEFIEVTNSIMTSNMEIDINPLYLICAERLNEMAPKGDAIVRSLAIDETRELCRNDATNDLDKSL